MGLLDSLLQEKNSKFCWFKMLTWAEDEAHGDEGETLYCICRSTDVSRFMIGCDHCQEWYHGDCINITEEHSKYIKKFYCVECREKNNHLTVVYKSKYADKIKELKAGKKDKKHKEDREDRERRKHKHKHDRKHET